MAPWLLEDRHPVFFSQKAMFNLLSNQQAV